MAGRYHLKEGIVIRRFEMPSGDVIVTLFSEAGKWRGIARKGRMLGGNVGRLSLFHDVAVQYYLKGDEDLALITQVSLSGALAGLTRPEVYPYAHLLAELIDKLSVDAQQGEAMYGYLAGGLRGLAKHENPEAVALVIAWKLLQQAGLAPRLQRCVHCNASEVGSRFDVAAGGMTCQSCNTGIPLSEEARALLERVVLTSVREALVGISDDLEPLWRLLSRYVAYHVGPLNSLIGLPHRPEASMAVASDAKN